MKFPDKSKIIRFQDKTTKWISDKWFILHAVFLVFYLSYVILKALNVKFFSNGAFEFSYPFSLFWFSVCVTGFILLSTVLIYGKEFKFRLYLIFIIAGYSLITVSYIKTIDPGLEWPGSDVAIGNYISAEETVKYGTFDLLKTWDERINPYEYTSHFREVKDSTRKFIEKYKLSGILFDKWKIKLDSTKYDIAGNDRPYVHSPLTTLTMGWWLKIFPFGKWSLEYQMLLLNILSLLLVILFAHKKSSGSIKSIAIISIATSAAIIRCHSPSVDQLSMLLFTIPVFMFLMYPSRNFLSSFLYGIIYGLCFYSKFTVLFFILLLILSFLFYIKELSLRSLLGLAAGLLVPVILFTASGYYFWLTFITGRIITQQISPNLNVNLLESLTKFLYYGPSFLLLSLLLIININRMKKKYYPVYVPVLLSLFFLIVFLYDQGAWNRYLGQYVPVVLLFVLSMDNTIELKKRDLWISIIANFIFLQLNTYF